jgi:plastocyanin
MTPRSFCTEQVFARLLGAFILICAVAVAWSPPASARRNLQGPVVLSVAAAQFYGYATPAMVVQQGGELSYANFDIVQHDVVQDVETDGVANKRKDSWCKEFKKGECPLFWSPRASLGEQVAVKGLQNLKAGQTYTFFCTLHPGMKGTLLIQP